MRLPFFLLSLDGNLLVCIIVENGIGGRSLFKSQYTSFFSINEKWKKKRTEAEVCFNE
jgi:hypothetical protein